MRTLLACVSLLLGSAVLRADVVVVLTPEHAAPYQPGETLDVAIAFQQLDDAKDHLLWGVALDFSQSDPELTLNSFEFDFSAVPIAQFFLHKEAFPTPFWIYAPTGGNPDPHVQWNLPGDGSLLTIGLLNITLPTDVSRPLLLDAISPASTATGFSGGYIRYGTGVTPDDPLVELTPGHGLTGGRLVIPEPATAILHVAFLSILIFTRRRSVIRFRSYVQVGSVEA